MWFYAVGTVVSLTVKLAGYHPDLISCLAISVPTYFLGCFVEGFMK